MTRAVVCRLDLNFDCDILQHLRLAREHLVIITRGVAIFILAITATSVFLFMD